jgi:hypothetical protein
VPFAEIRKAKLILTDALLKAFAPEIDESDDETDAEPAA